MSNIFEKLELFSNFNEKQVKAIFKLGEKKLIESNNFLFKEGEVSKGLYIVLGGKFSVYIPFITFLVVQLTFINLSK